MTPLRHGESGARGTAVCHGVRTWDVDGGRSVRSDRVAMEEPLEIRVETKSIAVVMRTPGHDEELAAGFALSEGIVRDRESLRAVRLHPRNRDGNVVDVFLGADADLDLARFTRHVFASASCGLCGSASIQAVRRRFPRIRDSKRVSASVVRSLPERVFGVQEGFAATGGLHAAAVFSSEGELLVHREDVGRHNAVDKVFGRLFLDGRLPVRGGILWVSGRTSFEIVQKALSAGIAMVAAVGAPSSLAVDFARANGQTLIGFLRKERFNVYSGPRRVEA